MTIRQNICRLAVATAMLGSAIFLAPAAVDAQSNDMMQMMGRLRQLENQVQTLSRAFYRGEQPPVSANTQNYAPPVQSAGLASFEVRLSQMESEIRNITGRMEQQDHEIAQLKSRFDRALSDMEMRLGGNAGSNPVMPQQYPNQFQQGDRPQMAPPAGQNLSYEDSVEPRVIPQDGQIIVSSKGRALEYQSDTVRPLGVIRQEEIAPPGQAALKMVDNAVDAHNADMTPAKLYNKAFLMVREGNYDRAEQHFTEFLTQYPSDDLASNAQYWLAETYYVRGNFQQAAQMFAKGYQTYPKSNKTPDNLLKLALSLEKLDKTEDACLTFKQLDKELPASDTPVKRRANKEKERLGCAP